MQLARTALKERIGHLNRLILSSKSIGVNGNRSSAGNSTKQGSGNSARHTDGRESAFTDKSRPSSAATEETLPVNGISRSFSRTISAGSTIAGTLPAAHTSHMILAEDDEEDSDPEGAGLDPDGHASKTQQIRALQADLADKNRYISTLEKRLLQARRSSHGRTGMARSASRNSPATTDGDKDKQQDQLLREKDTEIEELRAKLDDQIRMATALRSAARKRDILENSGRRDRVNGVISEGSSPTVPFSDYFHSAHPLKIKTTSPSGTLEPPPKSIRRAASYNTTTTTTGNTMTAGIGGSGGHGRYPSNTSSGVNVNFSRLTPMALLSSSSSPLEEEISQHYDFYDYDHYNDYNVDDGPAGNEGVQPRALKSASVLRKVKGQKSVEEISQISRMTKMLDEMISQKAVEDAAAGGGGGSRATRGTDVLQTLPPKPLVLPLSPMTSKGAKVDAAGVAMI